MYGRRTNFMVTFVVTENAGLKFKKFFLIVDIEITEWETVDGVKTRYFSNSCDVYLIVKTLTIRTRNVEVE